MAHLSPLLPETLTELADYFAAFIDVFICIGGFIPNRVLAM